MKQVNTHKRTLVAAGIAAALGMQANTVFAADESAADDVEVIEIKGIRGSVTKSADLKRSSQGIVDAITAEDIGKFPDTNLAESLQRITGVSIDRQNNEGSRVTVRGWGPEFNLITLNNRQMPAANLSATSVDTRRSYDFANLAAESVSGVQVYKTGKANVTTGGIGAVINIETFKPLKNPGLTASVGVKGVMDDVRAGDDVTPEISGIYSNTFADDTIGISLTASRAVRDNYQAAGRVTSGWNTSINANGNIEGAPQNFMYTFEDYSRTRTNAQLTLQFRPSEKITATVDYTYSELDSDVARQELSAWFGGGNFSGGNGVDDWATVYTPVDANNVTSPAVLYNGDCCDVSAGVGSWGTTNESDSLGLNIEFDATENLSFTLDYHSSTAEAKPKDHRGSNNVVTATQFRRNESVVDFTQDIPILQMFVTDTVMPFDAGTTLNGALDPSLIIPSGISYRNGYMKTEIEQLQLSGEYVFDDGILTSIDFGFMSQTMDNQTAFSLNQGGDWGNGIGGAGAECDAALGGWGTPCGDGDGHYRDEAFTVADLTDFPGAGVGGKMLWVDYNMFTQDIAAWYQTAAGNPFADCATGTLCVNPNFDTDMRLTEEQTAFYIQANLEFELAGMLTTVNIGARHEETKVESNSLIPNYTSLVWQTPNELLLSQGEGQNFAEGSGDYSYFLPNIDFNIEITDDLVARASVSKSIARANYGALQAGAVPSSSQARSFDNSTANAGDPSLKPYESDNFDISVEYYYDEGSYVSAGYYAKTVNNFHGSTITSEVIYPDLVNPATGPRFTEAQGAVVNQGNAANEILAYYQAQGWVDATTGALLGDTSSYSPLNYTVTKPVNQDEAEVDGFELAAQHLFGDSGFGGQVNYTTVSSDLEYDNSMIGADQFALPGLSDTANLVAFYDKDGLQVRVAYNWRDEFMNSTLGGSGNGQNEPGYVEAYGQLDLSVNYQLTEQLSLAFEGINVTESSMRIRARGERMTVFAADLSARYSIGVRYEF